MPGTVVTAHKLALAGAVGRFTGGPTVTGHLLGMTAAAGAGGIAAPSAPADLAAGTPGNATVPLTWTAASNAAWPGQALTYNVYFRTPAGSGAYTRFAANVAAAAATVTGLTNDSQYGFTVTSVGPGGESAKPTEVTATPTAG